MGWRGLFLGSLHDALDDCFLRQCNVTHAVSITWAPLAEDGLQRMSLRVEDDPDEDMFSYFASVCNFIDSARGEGGNVLVHCDQGISRSAALAAAYLMRCTKRPALDVLRRLKDQRPIIAPNKGFLSALIEWEQLLKLGTRTPTLCELSAVCHPIAQYARMEILPVLEGA